MPLTPSFPTSSTIRYGKRFSRSSSSATGATSRRAKSRTVSRGSRCSAVSPKSTSAGQVARQLDEQPHPVSGRARADVGATDVIRGAGDVQVGPGPAVHELFEERGGVDRARLALRRAVGEVGVPAPSERLVLGMEWKAPGELPASLGRRAHSSGPLVV